MKSVNVLASFALLAATALGSAQGFSQATASSGSVAGKGGAGDWAGLAGSAASATIGYGLNGSGTAPPNALKFASGPSGPQGQNLPGFEGQFPGGFASSQGASTVSGPGAGSGAPNYYSAGWSANMFTDGTGTGTNESGTFDPYDIRYGDVSPLAGPGGGPVDLYFQSGLGRNGTGGGTFLSASANTVAAYGYQLFLTEATGERRDILKLDFSTATGLAIDFNENSGLELFLLGVGANDPSVDPDDRIAAGVPITSDALATGVISPIFNANGSLTQELVFGVRRRIVVASGGAPDDLLFRWHTDTTNRVATVPEPATFAVLALGATALLRRRRKS